MELIHARGAIITAYPACTRTPNHPSMSLLVDLSFLVNLCRQQKSLTRLHHTVTTAVEQLRGIRGELEGLNRGHSPPHFIPLDPRQGYGVEAFTRKELHRLSKSYVENVHALHPVFDKPQQMCNEFIDDPAVRKGIIGSCVRNVQVLLLFALGSCQSIADDTKHSRTMPGQVYYSYAKDILRFKLGECNIPIAQALTLAALYTNQNGMLEDSLAHLCNARDIYRDILRK